MASRRIEGLHTAALTKLLSESGLQCMRTVESTETSSLEGELEETGQHEEYEEVIPEEVKEEEIEQELVGEIEEEQPEIFPTPSLRHVLPDRIREIGEHNKLHVLPEEFKTEIDPASIPKINSTAPQKYIDILADIVGCQRYKNNLAEYWFLDTLANLLRRAQEDGLDRPAQVILILWFCEWMKEMQHFDAADRQRMLRRFQDNMLSAAKFIAEEERLPTPAEAGVRYKAGDDIGDGPELPSSARIGSKHSVTFEGAAYECSLQDLVKILHYIFDLFSTEYQYNLVRSVFTFSPEYTLIDGPHPIQNPKRMYAPLKIKPKKEKSPKKEKAAVGKGKKKEVFTEEYLELLELIARDEREQDERDERDREEWNKKSHILPLHMAAPDDFFDKYWPPPPPEPEPEPVPEPKVKGKKGKK